GRLPGRAGEAEEVRGQVRPPVHAPGRHRAQGGRRLRRVGREGDVRPQILGQPALDVLDRRQGQDHPRLPEGVAEDSRRRGSGGVGGVGAMSALPYVDPQAPRGALYKLYVKFLGTRLAAWLSMHVVWRVDPLLMRATGGRLGMGLMVPTALLETRGA